VRRPVKDVQPEDLLHAVRVAARGDALLAQSITRKLISRYVTQPLHPYAGTALKGLTNRAQGRGTVGRVTAAARASARRR
jgi:DNA-binding NarL/FixJ family response regulator